MIKILALVPPAVLALTAVATAQVGGSYQRTCDNIRQRGPVLSAECETVDGDTRRTSLDLRGCSGGVTNSNGRLTCARRAYRGYDDGSDDRPRYGYGSRGGYDPYGRGRSFYGSDGDDRY